MSLPTPTTSKHDFGPTLSPQQQQQLDAPLIALAQRCNGDLRILFHSFFSFLNRRTDFYCVHNQLDVGQGNKVKMGFQEGDAEKLLLAAFKQFPLRSMPPSTAMKVNGGKVPAISTSSVKNNASNNVSTTHSSDRKNEETNVKEKSNAAPSPTNTKSSTNEKKDSEENKSGVDKKNSTDAAKASVNNDEDEDRYAEQIPVGNGGSTKHYKWTQTLDEITIALPLPVSTTNAEDGDESKTTRTRAKDLNVEIKRSSISIQLKNDTGNHILQGDFLDKIRTDESTWTIESNVLLITLDKMEKRWWNRVLVDEKEMIDIELVDKTHKISDYDEATQGMIRKILFDQRQERLGLPTSDEIEGTQKEKGVKMATSATVKKFDGGELKELPPGVEFIDKHNFPGGKR